MNKEELIKKIKTIIGNWGGTTSTELGLDHSPCIKSIGNGKKNISSLIEHFNPEDVVVVTYQDEIELDEEYVPYEELDFEILEEIMDIIDDYDADMTKTMDRIKNENF